MKFKVVKRCQEDLDPIQGLLKSFLPFARKRMEFNKPPTIFFQSDARNAERLLGKTAHYDPTTMHITLYITGRHPKDVLRSLSHELVHHGQNCRGEFGKTPDTAPGYAQTDDHLRGMEEEAYKVGNLCLRDWEDGIKTGKIRISMPLKESLMREQEPEEEDLYQVVAGDTLAGISQKHYGDLHKWPLIYKHNIDIVGGDPDYIEVGMKLKVPEVSAWNSLSDAEIKKFYSLSSHYGEEGEIKSVSMEDSPVYSSGNYIFPVGGGRITSRFGMRGPIHKLAAVHCDRNSDKYNLKMCKRYSSPHKHEGVDIGTAIGTPVVAPFDGKIIKVKTGSKSAGNYIVLKTKEERPIFHTFMHLGDNLPTINQEFKSGDVVAYVGRTGAGTGAHLHWETSMGLLRKKFDPLSLYQKRSLQEWKNAELNRLLLEKFNLGDKK